MSVVLGSDGFVKLKRNADESGFIAKVAISDVNTDRNRFSYDYIVGLGGGIGGKPDPETGVNPEMSYVPLITGDRVRFARVEQTIDPTTGRTKWITSTKDQELVSKFIGSPGVTVSDNKDFTAYVNVDGMGAIRLYNTFEAAINFDKVNNIDLNALTEDHYFRVYSGQLDAYRGLARIQEYEFTTQREQIDITSLGKNFRRFYSNGLISGQGRINCLFPLDYCGEANEGDCENVRYLAELILRLEEGAVFGAQFFLKTADGSRDEFINDRTLTLFYECQKCLITSVGINVNPQNVLQASVEFVTTGPFDLRYKFIPSYLLVEGITRGAADAILQEDDDEIEIFRSENDD